MNLELNWCERLKIECCTMPVYIPDYLVGN